MGLVVAGAAVVSVVVDAGEAVDEEVLEAVVGTVVV